MTHRHIIMATLVAAASVAPLAWAGAQQRDSSRADTLARPFVRGGVYDKPYQSRLLGRTAIGGYAEAHARWQQVEGLKEEAGFEAKRFNLFTSTRVSDFVRLGAEIEFEDGGREIALEYAAIDVLIHPAFTVRGGMVLSPLGRFNLSHDSPLNEFTDRPLVSTDILGVALSEPGFGVLGQVSVASGLRLTYEAYATNGFSDGLITASESGTRIPLGRKNFEDNNGRPSVVGRITLSPGIDYEIGLSAHHGAYNVFNVEGTAVDEQRNLSIAVIDGEARAFGIQLSGEAAIANIDVSPGLRGIYAARQHGWYIQGVREFGQAWVRTMPSSSFALKARWDRVDFDSRLEGSSAAQVTVGLNFRPTRESAIKLDYVRGRGRDEFNNRADHAFMLASLATYF